MEHLFLMFLDHTQRRRTVGRTPLDEWSARRRDLYLATHDTHDLSRGAACRPLACWDRGFESHRGHGYLSVGSVVCCQVEVSAMSWSLVQRSPTEIFRTRPDRPWGPPNLLYNGYRVIPGGKVRPGRDADPSPPSSAVGHERVELYLYWP